MRRLLRERRRIVVVGGLVFAALALAGGVPLAPLPAQPAALLVALAMALAMAVLAVLAPATRGYGEAVGLASLALGGLMRALPGGRIDLAGPNGNILVVLAIWIGLLALARGARRALGALPLPRLRNRRFKARAMSSLDIHRLWYGLAPAPAHPARAGDPNLSAIEEMGLRLGRVRLVSPGAAGLHYTTDLQILEVEAPFHIRMRVRDDDTRGVIGATGVSEIFLVDLGDRRLVLFAHEFADIPVGRALLAWIDDAPGRMLDRRLSAIGRGAARDDADRPGDAGDAGASAFADWDADAALDAGPPDRTAARPAAKRRRAS